MKVAVIAANGKAGNLILKEAKERDYDITAIVRDANKVNEGCEIIEKDIFDLTLSDLKKYDVVIDAFGAWTAETLPLHRKTLNHLCDILSGTKTRLLVVGGAGSLYVNPEHTLQVMDSPDFPESFKPLASAQSEALDDLRKRSDVKWTFLSPSANFVADGKRTGKYIIGGEELILNAQGESRISYADYAIAMVDEIVNKKYIQKRFSVTAN